MTTAGADVVEGSARAARPGRGFRPASRRRTRIAAGAAIAAAAVGGNVLVYSSLDDNTEVVQVVRNVRAGDLITTDDLRIVAVDLEPSVPYVAAADIGLVANQYARVYIASGTLMVNVLVQPEPLVTPGQAVVAIELRPTRTPADLVERSRVQLVIPAVGSQPAFVTEGRVTDLGARADGSDEAFGLSVEVRQEDAPLLAASDDVRVVLLDPAPDPLVETAG